MDKMWHEFTFGYKVKGYESIENQDTVLNSTLEGAKDHLLKRFKQVYPNQEIDQSTIILISQV